MVEWVGWSVKIPVFQEINGIIIGLGIIMFGMGMTLYLDEIKRSLRYPARIFVGVGLQFLFMPFLAFALVVILGLPLEIGMGIILLGCCPGGTASNVITFLADADVPLSVAVTLVGTLLAPLLTPWLFWLYGQKLLGVYLGETINVPILLLMKSTFVVVVPILFGLFVKWYFELSEFMDSIENIFSVLSISVIALIVAYVVSTVDPQSLAETGSEVFVSVVLHNGLGLLVGFYLAVLLGFPRTSTRALSIEVGMQNSGLALALASLVVSQLGNLPDYGEMELAMLGLPAILFSVWHNITGPALASYWSSTNEN